MRHRASSRIRVQQARRVPLAPRTRITAIGRSLNIALAVVLTLGASGSGAVEGNRSSQTLAGCDYYASPTGGGNGRTSSAPLYIRNFWSVAAAGDTLCLLDGTYRGDRSMIAPPAGLSGTATSPITIRALNDGGVTIDAEFARFPIYLSRSNSWWVFEGFNAKSSYSGVITIQFGSNHNVFRRMTAWDAHIAKNTHVVIINDSADTLLEDVALFGTGHTMLTNHGTKSTGTVLRRVWGRFEGTITQGFAETFQLGYDVGPSIRCENCLATYSGESMPAEYEITNPEGHIQGSCPPYQRGGRFTGKACRFTQYEVAYPSAVFASQNSRGTCAGLQLLGSLAYIVSTPGKSAPHYMLRVPNDRCATITHVAVVVSPTYGSFGSVVGLRFDPLGPGASSTISHITSVRADGNGAPGGGGDYFGRNWVVRRASIGTSRDLVASPWTSTSGANLCYRWVNGVSTTTPLWPWPMNERIKAATASAGAYTGDCPNCVGGRRVRTATDVTSDVERLLGTIPSACRVK